MKNEVNQKGSKQYRIFYVVAVLLVLYMGYSAINNYTSFVDYCAAYNYNVSDKWGMFFQTLLAAIIPCIAYATALYGIGYLIKLKEK